LVDVLVDGKTFFLISVALYYHNIWENMVYGRAVRARCFSDITHELAFQGYEAAMSASLSEFALFDRPMF
jgi:hypothetical protein